MGMIVTRHFRLLSFTPCCRPCDQINGATYEMEPKIASPKRSPFPLQQDADIRRVHTLVHGLRLGL